MKVLKSIFILSLSIVFAINFLNCEDQKLIVSVPVADFIENPRDVKKIEPCFSSQLLLNDKLLLVLDYENGWLCVDCIEQQEFCEGKFEFRRGFVRKDQVKEIEEFEIYNVVVKSCWVEVFDINSNPIMTLSIGTKFKANIVSSGGSLASFLCIFLPDGRKGFVSLDSVRFFITPFEFSEEDIRNGVCIAAKTFLGTHYCSGGRSAEKRPSVFKEGFKIFDITQITGVDHSSLINLVYRANGFEIPSSTVDLFYNSNELQKGSDLKKGDLIFFEFKMNGIKNAEVFLYLGNDEIIVTSKKRAFCFCRSLGIDFFGVSIKKMKNEKIYNNKKVYLRSLLNNLQIIKSMRDFFLFGTSDEKIHDRAITI